MPGSTAGKSFFDSMGAFCRDAVAGRAVTDRANGKLKFIGFTPKSSREIPLEEVSPLSDTEVMALLREAREWRVEGEKVLRSEWNAKDRDRARL